MVLNINNFSVGNIFRGSLATVGGIITIGLLEYIATPLLTVLGTSGTSLAAYQGARIIVYPIVLFYVPLREFFRVGG